MLSIILWIEFNKFQEFTKNGTNSIKDQREIITSSERRKMSGLEVSNKQTI